MCSINYKFIRFEDAAWLNQKILFELHKIKRWKAAEDINFAFGLPSDLFIYD